MLRERAGVRLIGRHRARLGASKALLQEATVSEEAIEILPLQAGCNLIELAVQEIKLFSQLLECRLPIRRYHTIARHRGQGKGGLHCAREIIAGYLAHGVQVLRE